MPNLYYALLMKRCFWNQGKISITNQIDHTGGHTLVEKPNDRPIKWIVPKNIECFGFTNQSIYMWGLCGGLWDFKNISHILIQIVQCLHNECCPNKNPILWFDWSSLYRNNVKFWLNTLWVLPVGKVFF